MLIFSMCAVGYVIFFRTVVAQEILPSLRDTIVFEEPDPPLHIDVSAADEGEASHQSSGKSPAAPEQIVVEPIRQEDVQHKTPDLPKVAIIIDDLGYDENIAYELLNMPIELTYSFLPFAPHTRKLELVAHRWAKTVFLHLPLQPKGHKWNPGPGALFLEDSPETQVSKFLKCLDEVPHAVGVNNHMGSLYTEDAPAMSRLMQQMSEKSLIFIDSVTTMGSVGSQTARAAAIKSARRSVFLDNILDESTICRQIETLVKTAEREGLAIGIGHPHRATVNALTNCTEQHLGRVQYVGLKKMQL